MRGFRKTTLFGLLTILSAPTCFVGDAFGNVRLAFDSTSLDFGNVALSASRDLTLEVWDTSSVDIVIDRLTFGGSNVGDFSILTPPTPFVVSAGSTIHQKIIVQFSPQAIGIRSALLLIETSDGTVTIPLSGTCGKKSSLSWSVATIDFGKLAPGGLRDSVIKLYSNGPDTVTVVGLQVAAADMSFQAQCLNGIQPPFKLAPGDSVAVMVSCQGLPLQGIKNGQLLAFGSTLNTPSCDLTGDVELGSFLIQDTQDTIDFGLMYAGEVRDTTVLLTNSGGLDLLIEGLDISPSGDDFTLVSPMSPQFVLRAGVEQPVTIHANPGLTTSHTAQLQVVSQLASPKYRSARLLVTVVQPMLSTPSRQDLSYNCAMSATVEDTVPISNTGLVRVVITSIAPRDANVTVQSAASFPDTLRPGETQSIALRFDPSTAINDTVVLQMMGGDQVMISDTIALHAVTAKASAFIVAAAAAVPTRQNIDVRTATALVAFDLHTIIVHLDVQDSNVATIDSSTIALAPGLSNATITSIVQEPGGYAVTIVSASPITGPAGSSLIGMTLNRFVSRADSTNVIATIETPERAGCLEWAVDTAMVGAAQVCGKTALQEILSGKPIIVSAVLRENPIMGQNAYLTVVTSVADDVRFELSNALGKNIAGGVFHLLSGSNDCLISLPELSAGAYMVRLSPMIGLATSVRLLKIN